jgi:hypothetical protein
MRSKYIIITTVLAFACGAGAASWRAANQIRSRIQAATLAAMAQSNAEEKAKAAELALGMSEAAQRIAWDELALERKRREAAEQALLSLDKMTAKQAPTRKEQTELDNTKVQLLQQSATTRTRKTRAASKHGGEARPEAYDANRLQFEGTVASRSVRTLSRGKIEDDRLRTACVVTFSTRHNRYERRCWRYRGSARGRRQRPFPRS